MSIFRRVLVIVMAAGAAGVAARSPQAGGSRTHTVVVTVLDKSGKPATGLGPADFKVRENDVAREVLDVGPATGPMTIALLYDTSDPTQQIVLDLRRGLQTFVRTLLDRSPESQIGLTSFGERPTKETPFTNSAMTLDRSLQRVFARPNAGAYLLEAILEAVKDLKASKAARPVVVAFVNERAVEFSPDPYQRVADALKSLGAPLWSVVLHGDGAGGSDESRNRATVLGDVTVSSGGLRETILARTALESSFLQLADRLTSQYVITYSRPDTLIPPDRIEVSVQREGLRLVAPRWTGR